MNGINLILCPVVEMISLWILIIFTQQYFIQQMMQQNVGIFCIGEIILGLKQKVEIGIFRKAFLKVKKQRS